MPDFVPPVPDDWEEKEAFGTPYLLGIANGSPQWRAVVVLAAVEAENGETVTANDRPVSVT